MVSRLQHIFPLYRVLEAVKGVPYRTMSSNLPAERKSTPAELIRPDDYERLDHSFGRAQAAADDETPLDLRRYMSALLRYKWLILLGGVVGVGGGFGASRMSDPEYQSTATIWIEQEGGGGSGNRSGGGGGGRGGPITAEQVIGGGNTAWVDLAKSNKVLDLVVSEMKLYLVPDDPEDGVAFAAFQLKDRMLPGKYRIEVDPDGRSFVLERAGAEVQRGAVTDSVGPSVGFLWQPGPAVLTRGRIIKFQVLRPRAARQRLGKQLEATIPRGANFIRLQLTGTNPQRTAATLNSLVGHFITTAAELKRDKLAEVTGLIAQQLTFAENTLHAAEGALQSFRVNTITLPQDPTQSALPLPSGLELTSATTYQRFFQMRIERENLRHDRDVIQRVLANAVDSGVTSVELEAIASVRGATELNGSLQALSQKRAELRALQSRYTPEYAPAQRLAEEITVMQRQTVPGLIRSLVRQLETRMSDLDLQLASGGRELQQIPTRTIEEARLRREVTISEQLYTTLQSRYDEARLAVVSAVPDLRVLDLASPQDQPLKQKGIILLLGGLMGGLGLAVGGALLLDQLDKRVRYPDQVTRDMGLTILGTIPRLGSGRKGPSADDTAQVVEALRTLRLNLVHAYGTAGPLVVTITSPGSGDGKSFLASNLALAFADAGRRTLLVDGDIRRGALHRVLNAKRKPGLLDHLSGQATPEEIVQQTTIPSVDFIGCGTRKAGGPELLASTAMSQLLIGLRSRYDVILIDSPPLGAGVDPLILGSLTGSLLLVLRTGVTDRDLAEMKLLQVDRLPIRVLGAVLNDVQASGVYRYYAYLSGYHAQDEEEVGAAAGLTQLRGLTKTG